MESKSIAVLLLIIAAVVAVIGLVIYFAGASFSWFGKLPGDLKIEGENFSFYFPMTTMIILSLILTVILRVILYFFN